MLGAQEQTTLLVWGIMVHLVADWLFQNEWMVLNKLSLRHPAAWVHGGIHAALLLLVLTWPLALLVGLTHVVIDTRLPVRWWMRVVKQMPAAASLAATVEIWLDQVFHLTVLALVVLVFY